MHEVDMQCERLTVACMLLCVQVYGLLDRSWDQFIAFSQSYEAAGCKITALAAENVILQGRVREASAAAAAEVAEVAVIPEVVEMPAQNQNDKKMTKKQLKAAQKKSKRGMFGPGKQQQRNLMFA
jgi:hypothetical protein